MSSCGASSGRCVAALNLNVHLHSLALDDVYGRSPDDAANGGRSDLQKIEAEAGDCADVIGFVRAAIERAVGIVLEHRDVIEAVADLLEARPEFGSGELAAAVVAAWQAPVIREAVAREFWESVAREADEARRPRRVAP